MAEPITAFGSFWPIPGRKSDKRCSAHGLAIAMDRLKNAVGESFDPSCVSESIVDGEAVNEKRVLLTYTPKAKKVAKPRAASKPAGKGKGKPKGGE